MKVKPFFLALCFLVFSFSTNAQSRILQDSILFSWSKAQVDSFFNEKLGPLVTEILQPQYGVSAHKVLYRTLNYDSTETYASGLLLIPNSDYCSLPIVSYQHGTTVLKNDAPSRFRGQEVLITLALASTGIIACMPDYHGMGDGEGYHPYQNARTEAFSVIDIIRTAKEVCDSNGVHYGSQLFLTGYSQGGHATMAAHKWIQEFLSDEMQVTASAPMSGAYDMSGIQTDLLLLDEPYSDPYYLPYLIFGNNPIYHFFDSPDSILKEPYALALPSLMDGYHDSQEINAAMNDTVKYIFRDGLEADFVADSNHFFRKFLRDNDVYEWVPQSPVRMYFCPTDEKVPFHNTYVAFDYFKEHGALHVDTVNVGQYLHTDCAQPALINAKFWIDEMRDVPLSVVAEPHYASSSTAADGSISLAVSGGKAPVAVSWNNGQTGSSLQNVTVGEYSYTVTDGNGCEKSGTVSLFVSGIAELQKAQVRLYPSPATNSITIETAVDLNETATVFFYNALGQPVKQAVLQSQKQEIDISNLPSGVYSCRINNLYVQSLVKN